MVSPARWAHPRYLTVAEVGALLRASKMTVYRLVHAGAPEAVRIGGRSMSPEPTVRPAERQGVRSLRARSGGRHPAAGAVRGLAPAIVTLPGPVIWPAISDAVQAAGQDTGIAGCH